MVWYACYGSNLAEQRFRCYIEGGIPNGSDNRNPGSRDPTLPVDSRPFTMPARLYFAKDASSWGGGGAAFVELDAKAQTRARIYLIAYDQFQDVFAQENGINPQKKGSLLPPLRSLTAKPEYEISRRTWYPRVINLGRIGGHPVFTFSSSRKVAGKEPINPPHKPYTLTIARGLLETFPNLRNISIYKYLHNFGGIPAGVSSKVFMGWLGDLRRSMGSSIS